MARVASASTDHGSHQGATIEYELRATRELPCVDCSRLVAHALLSRAKRYVSVNRATSQLYRAFFISGIGLAAVAPFVAARTHRLLAWVSTALLILPLLRGFLLLRIDVLALLTTTYELWYFSVLSLSACVLACANLGDGRALTVVCLTLTCCHALTIDASSRDVPTAVLTTAMGALAVALFAFAQAFGFIEDYGDLQIASYSGWTLDSSQIIVNSTVAMVAAMSRNAIRKWIGSAPENGTTLCISYRVQLRFAGCAARHVVGPIHVSVARQSEPLSPSLASRLALLPDNRRYDARKTVFGNAELLECRPLVSWTWTLIGSAGIVASIAGVAQAHSPPLAIFGAVCSLAYTARQCRLHNRQLLRRMILSFDFCFITTQTYVGHAALATLLRSEPTKWLPILSSCLWLHWVFTLDMLTPPARKSLGRGGISVLAPAVLVLAVAAMSVLVYDLLLGHQCPIQDRVLFRIWVGDRSFGVSAVSFLLGRVFTAVSWCCRLLWRLYNSPENALLIVQGTPIYRDPEARTCTFNRSKIGVQGN